MWEQTEVMLRTQIETLTQHLKQKHEANLQALKAKLDNLGGERSLWLIHSRGRSLIVWNISLLGKWKDSVDLVKKIHPSRKPNGDRRESQRFSWSLTYIVTIQNKGTLKIPFELTTWGDIHHIVGAKNFLILYFNLKK